MRATNGRVVCELDKGQLSIPVNRFNSDKRSCQNSMWVKITSCSSWGVGKEALSEPESTFVMN
eukprot:CAMPEP_0168210910 /NCGR_PEP_ID=MMETSP0140_2-20121125/3426_1 /TAXON_ID=44445 /ORGANISM="Pseudo-nitzschia australis, Strain 10249 10 AB" /LENGTH=62 /DNA_ID=CAMNT_0008137551 /DNA_START=386 /DNA_END=574 /DNA_ORIENTATION=-